MREEEGNLNFKLPAGRPAPVVDFHSINLYRIKYFFYLLLYVFGLLIYMYGMLPQGHPRAPHDTIMAGHSTNDQLIGDEPDAKIDRLVLMIVDGLRADSLFSPVNRPHWPHLHHLSTELDGICSLSHIQAPSVTLPRLKAILSGRVPTFTDVIENLNAVELADDNWLTPLTAVNRTDKAGWKFEFYGDNTWLKLFPNSFSRSDGTHSFFVNDFYEVDTNVTRHLSDTLTQGSRWNGLILHYLGLDHIGHVEGPSGSSVGSKMSEMDSVVKMIVNALLNHEPYNRERWLFILSGDHGTADRGGHGGASPSELTTSMLMLGSPGLFTSPPDKKTQTHSEAPTASCDATNLALLPKGEQVDLSVLLGLLTGSGIPRSSLGSLPTHWISAFWSNEGERLKGAVLPQLLHLAQLSGCRSASPFISSQLVVDRNQCQSKLLSQADVTRINLFWTKVNAYLACLRTSADQAACSISHAIESLNKECRLFIQDVQHAAVSRTGLMHETAIIIGCVLMWLVTLFLWYKIILQFIWDVPRVVRSHAKLRGTGSWLALSCSSCRFLCAICTLFILIQAVSLGSSSYSEEEHQFWYYFGSNLLVLLAAMFVLDRSRVFGKRLVLTSIVVLLLLDRLLLRLLHSTGYASRNAPDLAQWFYEPGHSFWHWSTHLIGWALLLGLRAAAIKFSTEPGMCESPRHRTIRWAPLISGLVVCMSQLFYRLTVALSMHNGAIYAARLGYLALMGDLLAANAWRNTNSPPASGPSSTLRAFWFDLLHPVNVFPLFICLLARPVVSLLWVGVVVKEFACANLVRIFWDRMDNLPYVPSRFGFLCVWLLYWIQGWITFYQQGNSSSLASLDVSAGYVGLSSYIPFIVGSLLACHTYAGPLYWQLAFFTRFLSQSFERSTAYEHACFRLGCVLLPSTFCATVCFLLQSHISIWTVYTPKMFYLATFHAILAPLLLAWGAKIV